MIAERIIRFLEFSRDIYEMFLVERESHIGCFLDFLWHIAYIEYVMIKQCYYGKKNSENCAEKGNCNDS